MQSSACGKPSPWIRAWPTRAATGGSVGYRLDGTMTLDAGLLGRPSFGPMTLLQGIIENRR